MSISNKDYLNELIDKAKKSWAGVDVESYMKNLRDDSIDKEVAENLSKEVASYITEQIKSNMDKVTIKCRDLMVGDWITNRNGFAMQITNVGEDYAYATWEDNEGDPWEFDDNDDQPQPITITPEILEKNGWWFDTEDMWRHDEVDFGIERWNGRFQCYDISQIKLDSVHELQRALRCCGLWDMADNFKIQL